MAVVAEGGVAGVTFTLPTLNERVSSMVPGSVPVWNCSVAVVVFAGMVICVVLLPLENIRSVELPGLGERERVAVTVSGSG